MLNPFIRLIGNIISIINFGLIVYLIIDVLIRLDIVNRYNPLVQKVHSALAQVFEPMLQPIRRLLSRLLPGLPIDISPLVLILLLHFIEDLLYSWFYTI